jgi:GTP cyclohydrolase I
MGTDAIALAWSTVLAELGYKLDDPHIHGTPPRIARFLEAWDTQSKEPPIVTTFPTEEATEMVVVKDISFYSLCAHHGLPFFGTAVVGYLPNQKLAGLSKFARIVDHFAHRFTVQERLTANIADHLVRVLAPHGLGVSLRATHLCMAMRGVQKPGHTTGTTALRGNFDKMGVREEFLRWTT